MEIIYTQHENTVIEEVCRICLSKNEPMGILEANNLATMLLEVAAVQLTSDDSSPYNLICTYCTSELSRCYNFKQQIIRSFDIGRWLIKRQLEKRNELKFIFNDDENENSLKVPPTVIKADAADSNDAEDPYSNESDEEYIPPRRQYKSSNASSDMKSSSVGKHDLEQKKPARTSRKKFAVENLTCDICQRRCPTANALMRHKKVHKDTKDYVCTKCGKAFKQSQTLADHMKRHYDLKKYACDICGKRFYKQYNVTMHMRMHTGEKPYKCADCDKAFTRPLLLRNHIKQRHTNDKKYICQMCGKGFIDGWQLKIHVRTHTGEKPHHCQYCDMSFAVSSSLHSHIRYKHTFEKNFICSVCAKAFTAKHTLDDHMRTHTGEKKPPRHECSVCGKKCDSTSTLKYHMRAIHTGEKPFECAVCEKRFVRKQHLTAHMRNHTGEKPYVCSYCGRAFSASSSFSIHKRTHTGERPFVCAVCGLAFIQSAGLKQHMRTHGQQ